MEKKIKENNPDYSKEQVAKTIGEIWFHNLSDKKRKQINERDRPAKEKAKMKREKKNRW